MKITNVITLLGCLLLSGSLFAQNSTFEWAKQITGPNFNYSNSITSDGNGGILVTGYFKNTADFDPGMGVFNLTAAGQHDIYVQKLDTNGNLQWAVQMGGTGMDVGNDITTDPYGNVYVTGYFWGTADFDPGIGIANLTSSKFEDAFVLKLDKNGEFQWVKQMGGNSYDSGRTLTCDLGGNVYTAGYFAGAIDFDPGMDTALIYAGGSQGNFLQKLDSSGNFVWVKKIGGIGSDYCNDIISDGKGDILITGRFGGTVDFDPGAGTSNMTSFGDFDMVVQRFDTTGNFIWAKQSGGTGRDEGNSIAVDVYGNVYTTGIFEGNADFDPGTATKSLISKGDLDIFVQKLDGSGNFVWAKQMGGSETDEGRSIIIDGDGYVYSTGFFADSVDFNPGPDTNELVSAGYSDIFIQKLDANGAFIWAQGFGGIYGDYGQAITTDADRNIYSTGFFESDIDFDPGASSTVLTCSGGFDIYVQKLSQCTPSTTTEIITTCDSITWIDGNTYTASDTTAAYYIKGSAGSGCDSIVKLDLTIYSVSDISTLVNGSTITASDSSATYRWLDCDNNYSPISGETNQSFTATSDGNYAVELAKNGCVDTSDCVTITNVGVIENSVNGNIRVYPNPSTGKFVIEFETVQKSFSVRLTSITGQLIETRTFQNMLHAQMELNQPNGVFLLKVNNEAGNNAVIKLIKH